MKQTVLIVYVFAMAAVGMSFRDDIAEELGRTFSMTRQEVQTCIGKANINSKHFREFVDAIDEDGEINMDKSTLKVGCFLNCLMQMKGLMSGPSFKLDEIKKMIAVEIDDESRINMHMQILNTCNDRLKDITNECELSIKFVLCAYTEEQRYSRMGYVL